MESLRVRGREPLSLAVWKILGGRAVSSIDDCFRPLKLEENCFHPFHLPTSAPAVGLRLPSLLLRLEPLLPCRLDFQAKGSDILGWQGILRHLQARLGSRNSVLRRDGGVLPPPRVLAKCLELLESRGGARATHDVEVPLPGLLILPPSFAGRQ